MRATAMPGQVDRHEIDSPKMARQRHEARGIVQPAVQGQHRGPAFASATQCGDPAKGNIDAEFAIQLHASSAIRAIAAACAAESLRQEI